MMIQRVFVYGTLMHGLGNHRYLVTSERLGEATSAPQYTMIDVGGFPAIFEVGSTAIHGELYDVTPETLARLDSLEGVPHLYTRAPIVLADGYRGAHAYFFPKERLADEMGARASRFIASGDYRKHRSGTFRRYVSDE